MEDKKQYQIGKIGLSGSRHWVVVDNHDDFKVVFRTDSDDIEDSNKVVRASVNLNMGSRPEDLRPDGLLGWQHQARRRHT